VSTFTSTARGPPQQRRRIPGWAAPRPQRRGGLQL